MGGETLVWVQGALTGAVFRALAPSLGPIEAGALHGQSSMTWCYINPTSQLNCPLFIIVAGEAIEETLCSLFFEKG